jgi:hypothetical protein
MLHALCCDEVDLFQYPERPEGDILQIAYGGGDHIESAGAFASGGFIARFH